MTFNRFPKHKQQSPSAPTGNGPRVRTLADMTPEERAAIERTYGAKIVTGPGLHDKVLCAECGERKHEQRYKRCSYCAAKAKAAEWKAEHEKRTGVTLLGRRMMGPARRGRPARGRGNS